MGHELNRNKKLNILFSAAAVFALQDCAQALNTEKLSMKNNMSMIYKLKPQEVNAVSEMFSEGLIYGRLRSNTFYYDHINEEPTKTKDHVAWGIGGSLIYSTGYLNGIGATVGMYTTHTVNTDNAIDGGGDYGKAGKDTYSRATGSGSHIDVLALAYLEYKLAQSSVKVGRQTFESTLIRTNDTKMIPNTFEGLSICSKDLEDTILRGAYFSRQKLRDHRDFHSVIAYDDWKTNPDAQDDSATHKGLSVTNIKVAGKEVEPGMFVVTVEDKSVKNLKLNLDAMYIDSFVSSAIAEVNYKLELNEGWALTPGVRYIHQMDEGAGKIGGAALNGSLAGISGSANGYADAASVDGGAWMARLKLAKGAGSVTAGYSAINDEADIIAPWRGFPTGGYTRSMAQYNWEANTRSWMLKVNYDFEKADIISGLRGALDYAQMDYDDNKHSLGGLSKTDRDIVHLDLFQTFEAVPNFELKLRMAMVDAQSSDVQNYNSYNEYRFEANYFF